MAGGGPPESSSQTGAGPETVLILSADATAAALVGALAETLGYVVRFARPPETVDASIRRTRPQVCLVDCDDPEACSDDVLIRATMRGIGVVLMGTADVLAGLREPARRPDLETLVLPVDAASLEGALLRALYRVGERRPVLVRDLSLPQNP